MSSDRTPERLIEDLVAAYNARELERFVQLHDPDIEMFVFPNDPILKGGHAFRQRYQRRFAQNPDLHATIVSRAVFGQYVVDHERVTGDAVGKSEAVVIYEVGESERVSRIWVISDAPLS